MVKKIIKILMFPVVYVALGAIIYFLAKEQVDFSNSGTMNLVRMYGVLGVLVFLATLVRMIKTISREKKTPFYIEKYWEKSVGGSDDAMLFVDYLENKNKAVLTVGEILSDLGFSRLQGNLRHASEPLEVPLQEGINGEIYQPIEVITVLAALILETRVSGSVCLNDLDKDKSQRKIQITYSSEELKKIKDMLQDYVMNAKEYDIYELMLETEAKEVLEGCAELEKEL